MNKKLFSNYQNLIVNHFNNENEGAKRILVTFQRLLEYIGRDHLSKPCKILDLGSGDGSFVKICEQNGLEAHGLDGSRENINFENDQLKFDDETFDVITMLSVIEHIQNPTNILREILRVLKKKGILIIITPNFRYAFKNFYDDPTHIRPYTDKSIDSLMKLHEFNTLKVVPMLINKSSFIWKMPFSFFISSILPFKNHQLKKIPFINFLRGQSTALISIAEKKNV